MTRQLDVSKVPENCGTETAPVLYKGVLYITECSTYLRALSPDTGNEIWSYKTNGPIMSSPEIRDDVIYFGSHDNHIYAVSTEGRLLWKFKTGSIVASGPAADSENIYVGSSDNNVYAIDRKTGCELWRFRTSNEVVSDILLHNGRLYFGSMDSYFYCIDTQGKLLWKFKTGDAIIFGKPVADEKNVYFGSADEVIYALSLNGEFIWGFKTGDAVINKPVLKNNVIYCGSRDSHLYALNSSTGVCLWRFNNGVGIPAVSQPLVTDSAVYFGSDKLYCLSTNGFVVWAFQTNDVVVTKPVMHNNSIIFCCMDGHIRAISQKGNLIWDKLTKSFIQADYAGFMPPPKNNPAFFEDRAKQLGIGAHEFAKKVSDFKPYAFKLDSDTKTYISSDAERYGGISESVGAYKDAGKGSMGMYSPAERKKKSETDKMLKDQFGIEY